MKKALLILLSFAVVFALVTYGNSQSIGPAVSVTSVSPDKTKPNTTPGETTPKAVITQGEDPGQSELTPKPTATVAVATPTPTPTPSLLRINEILPTNNQYNKRNGDYYDAIEIRNISDEPVMLSDYCLSDSKKKLTQYPLPEVELPAGGYAVFYCTGEYYAKDEYDLKFKLSYFGEKVYLADRNGNILDMVEYPELPQNVSYGRDGEEYRIYDKPTLGEANEGGYARMATQPAVDLAPGFFTSGQTVRFTTGGTIRYTLDGSAPTSASKVWDGQPIEITQNCSLRAYAEEDGCLASFPATFDYFIDAPEYELDVVRMSIKQADLDTMNENYMFSAKYAANISMFVGGELAFSVDCAASTFGGSSRAYIKKSYQIHFSTAYGPSKLQYRMFDNLDIDEFNSIVLRSGSQDNEATLMKDELVTSLVTDDGMIDDLLVQAYHPVNLYINDEYFGIYYIREHKDEDMIASHYGCDPEEVTLVKQMNTVKSGTEGREWKDLWKFITNNSLKDAEAYEYVKSVVDLQSVADYYCVQLWVGNIDPDNVCVFKPGDTQNGKWLFFLYDLDLTLCREPEGMTNQLIGTFNAGYYTFNALVYRLLENDEFRELFCERMAYIVSTVFTEERCNAYIDSFVERIDHDMVYNCARWHPVKDPVKKTNYRSYSGWQSSVNSLRKTVTGRGPKVIRDFVKAKGISDELVEKYFKDILD